MRGLEFALNNIGLAAFTTLAPAATFAYIALVLLALFGKLSLNERNRLENWLILPLAIATVGLIASATHLGDPGNALYVFMATGRSPLSNEVLTAILYLGTSCSYWLARIYFKNMRVIRALWLAGSLVTAVFFVWGTTNAYMFPSVVSWSTGYALVNLPLTGLAGCAPLVALTAACAGLSNGSRFMPVVFALSALASLAATVSMGLQFAHLGTLANAYGTAAELAPWYPVAIAVFAVCTLAAPLVALRGRLSHAEPAGIAVDQPQTGALLTLYHRSIAWHALAVLLAYAGIAGVRFCFYCFHMTAGVV